MTKALLVTAGFTAIMLMARWADAQAPGTAGKSSHTAADSHSMSAMDADLAERVRRSVASDRNLSTHAAKIKIVANDRTVHLTGLVQNEGEKAQINSKAAAIAGQLHVVNDLQVMPVATGGNALRDLLQQASEPRAPVAAAN
jgi:osmotically-inducible protein OsmY